MRLGACKRQARSQVKAKLKTREKVMLTEKQEELLLSHPQLIDKLIALTILERLEIVDALFQEN